ncbi:peptidyl-tRNA hydrolase, mitochondrial isoform X1 [Typha angustifolia]|uniref:peptidyl-tRNA hydrolase, mitochondrial isoform X1 n=1 Tax=Typha angustifolia TaxID=59011 RepID=UPI003C2DA83D
MLSHTKLLGRLFHTASSSCSSSSSCPKPWLFIGLGNPGEKYQSTRHNVGFDMIDAFARSQGIPMTSIHCKALFGEGSIGGVPVLLAKPQTYMNLSGESTGPLAAYFKLPLNRIIVMFDDMDLPCGVLRVQPKGGDGRHKGLKNVVYHFRGNREFGRLRIGIGRPPGQMDPKAFLLQKFNATARERIDSALEEGAEILKMLVEKGLADCARSSNPLQKYKHLRFQTLPV